MEDGMHSFLSFSSFFIFCRFGLAWFCLVLLVYSFLLIHRGSRISPTVFYGMRKEEIYLSTYLSIYLFICVVYHTILYYTTLHYKYLFVVVVVLSLTVTLLCYLIDCSADKLCISRLQKSHAMSIFD